jgi:tetratricopeptide (TPR) repeat protein
MTCREVRFLLECHSHARNPGVNGERHENSQVQRDQALRLNPHRASRSSVQFNKNLCCVLRPKSLVFVQSLFGRSTQHRFLFVRRPEGFGVSRRLSHEELICRGLVHHEARRYAAALPYFDRASRLAPSCPLAVYNRADTLHMLGRDAEAEPLLRELVAASEADLLAACPVDRPRSLQLDAIYLLFLVLVYGRGFSPEAFGFAERHLRQRRRGVASVWSAREVRAEVAAFRRKWLQGTPNQALQQDSSSFAGLVSRSWRQRRHFNGRRLSGSERRP